MILLKCVGDLCQYYDDLRIAGATAIMEKIFAELEYCWIVDFEDLIQLNIGGQLPVEMTICGFRLKFGDIVTLLVNTIDRMVIPGKFKLNKPIEYAALVYNHDSLRVILDFVELIQLESSDDEESIERRMTNDKIFPFMSNYEPQGDDFFESAALDQPDDFCLSYPIDIALSKLRVLTPDGLLTSFTMKDMQLGINPVSSENGIVSMELALQEVKHEMIKLEEVSVSAVVSVVDLETISQVNFEADRISIATGYSTKSWLGLIGWRFGKQKKAKRSWKPVALPFVHVQPLKIVATVDGVVGMKETSIFMKKFDGKEDTTTEDLIRFYSSSIVAKVPGIVTSTEVLGVDVADTVVGQYGTVYATHLLGSAGGLAGGVFCVAAYDGIRNAIVAGKKSRGVNSDDQWQLTDFGRGLRIVAKTAAKAGAEKRGKEGSDGNIVDWSYGMADDMGQYTSNNKSRLGAAGAATFGYAIGGLLAGPVGGVAGGIIASAVTGKTIDGYLKKIEDKEKWEKLKEGCSLYEGTMEDVNGEKIKRIIGILTRRRRYFKREWRPHLFILQSNELRYYETTGTAPSTDEQDAKEFNFDEDEAPRKRLCLDGAEVSIDDSRSVPNAGIFAFTIRGTANRMTWVLGAPTESDRDLWVARLTLVSQRQKNFVEGLYFGSQR